ncbi:expressed unknown protein [Seminavis robusta]|uniref:Uncharacterized protein n=1 Tax=Seminavis robusta TaxID=568900 RepID=A0A9N8DHA1_9STRA|nr:expressed unknown protein [Seminavis robusta]|eukprot:Sro144_g067060.1 n/a (284) ;mRNA; f:73446-74297
MTPTNRPKQRTARRSDVGFLPDPSPGGARGYDAAHRTTAVALRTIGEDDDNIVEEEDNPAVANLRQDHLLLASMTSYQASNPYNLAWRHVFWNHPYPFGVKGTSRSRIIDWDEKSIFVETVKRNYAYIGSRAPQVGPYEKYTLTAAIRGGVHGKCWFDFFLRTGAPSVLKTYDFLDAVINGPGGIGEGGDDNTHTFICDHRSVHHNPLIVMVINNKRHRHLFRAPYYHCDGPIEYFFNHVQQLLALELHNIQTGQQLEQAIGGICQRAAGFSDNYFAHCGYAP